MNRTSILAMAMVLVSSVQAQATLMLLGQGTSQHDTAEYNLVYDTDLDITWFGYTWGYHTWDSSMAWADALSVDFGGTVYDDWRLPTINDVGNDGCNYGLSGTDCGYNVDTSTGEMAHLWYDELGNLAYLDTSGNVQSGWGLTNTGDFGVFLGADYYWAGTEYALNTDFAWLFNTGYGLQSDDTKSMTHFAIAVRDGRAVIPEPTTALLLIAGLAGFAAAGRRRSAH